MGLRVHPDGRQIAIQVRSPQGPGEELWALENVLPIPATPR